MSKNPPSPTNPTVRLKPPGRIPSGFALFLFQPAAKISRGSISLCALKILLDNKKLLI